MFDGVKLFCQIPLNVRDFTMRIVGGILIALVSSALLLTGCFSSKNTSSPQHSSAAIHEEVAVPKEQDIRVLLEDKTSLTECKCDYNIRFGVITQDQKVLDAVSREVYPFAIMSANAYDKEWQIHVPGWQRIRRIVSKYGFSADVYLSEDDQEVVIAFRGTDDAKDWRYGNVDTDAHGQYADADTVFREVLAEYPDRKIMTIGHSLGGGLAIHVAISNPDVDAFAFDPSPRIFGGENYGKYKNSIVVLYETGEILSGIRPLFTTLRRVGSKQYRFNFLGGNVVKEHSIESLARCMYASINKDISEYDQVCKPNTLWN